MTNQEDAFARKSIRSMFESESDEKRSKLHSQQSTLLIPMDTVDYATRIGGIIDCNDWTHMFGSTRVRLGREGTIKLLTEFCSRRLHDWKIEQKTEESGARDSVGESKGDVVIPKIYWREKGTHPVVVDFTFRWNGKMQDGKIPEQFVSNENIFRAKLVRIVQQSVYHTINPSDDANELAAFLFASPHVEGKARGHDVIIRRYRIHLPHVRVDEKVDDRLLSKIVEYARMMPLRELKVSPTGDWENVISLSRGRNGCVPLYGCVEHDLIVSLTLQSTYHVVSESHVGLRATPVFDEKDEDGSEDYVEEGEEEVEPSLEKALTQPSVILNPQKHALYESFNSYGATPQWFNTWLPIFFTSEYYQDVITSVKEKNVKDIVGDGDREVSSVLLPMINPSRFIDRPFWINIGRSLFSIYEGDEKGLTIWREMTKKSLKLHGLVHENGEIPKGPGEISRPTTRSPPPSRIETARAEQSPTKDQTGSIHESKSTPLVPPITSLPTMGRRSSRVSKLDTSVIPQSFRNAHRTTPTRSPVPAFPVFGVPSPSPTLSTVKQTFSPTGYPQAPGQVSSPTSQMSVPTSQMSVPTGYPQASGQVFSSTSQMAPTSPPLYGQTPYGQQPHYPVMQTSHMETNRPVQTSQPYTLPHVLTTQPSTLPYASYPLASTTGAYSSSSSFSYPPPIMGYAPSNPSLHRASSQSKAPSDQEVRTILDKREKIRKLGVGFSERPDYKGKLHPMEEQISHGNIPEKYKLPSFEDALKKFEATRVRGTKRNLESMDIPHHTECDKLYYSFAGAGGLGITIKTIAWYAKIDNPNSYDAWHHKWMEAPLIRAMTCTHDDVSDALYRFNWLKYICTNGDGGWKEYRGSRWNKDKGCISLLQAIRKQFIPMLEKMVARMQDLLRETGDDEERAGHDRFIKRTRLLIRNLKGREFKMKVILSSCDLFYAGEEYDKFSNQNISLLSLGNGVMELWGTQAFFRRGKPEDYISIANSLQYDPNLSWKDKRVVELMEWLRRVYPDPEVLNFWLKYSASRLRGRNSDKIFAVFTGTGNNSKSMIIKLYEAAFEDYCVKVPITFLTAAPQSSSGPTPELARTEGARFVFADEPDPGDRIRPGNVKRRTGGDKGFARFLNENGKDIVETYGLGLVCNAVPAMPSHDKATYGRTRNFPHVSKWSHEYPESVEEQWRLRTFPIDPFFEDGIRDLAPAFMWILAQYYTRYVYEGMTPPTAVNVETQDYWDNNDPYKRFIDQCVLVVSDSEGKPDQKAVVEETTLYERFSSWFNIYYKNRTLPDVSLFAIDMAARWGKPVDKKWFGKQIRQGSGTAPSPVPMMSGMPPISLAKPTFPSPFISQSPHGKPHTYKPTAVQGLSLPAGSTIITDHLVTPPTLQGATVPTLPPTMTTLPITVAPKDQAVVESLLQGLYMPISQDPTQYQPQPPSLLQFGVSMGGGQ